MLDDRDAPWDLIRWVARQAPYWKVRLEGGSRSLVAIPRRGGDSSSGRLAPWQVNYYDLQRAVAEMGWRHEDGAKLRLIVEMRIESKSLDQIAKALPGRNSRWTVRKALDEAWLWICHPQGGRFLPIEAWTPSPNSPELDKPASTA